MFSIEEAKSGMHQPASSNLSGRPQGKLEAFWSRHYSKCVIICYWLLGLCNNFAYVIMLSAAHDILDTDDKKDNGTSNATTVGYNVYSNLGASNNKTNKYDCNDLSTGTILLADILPGIVAKFIAPFFMHKIKYNHRVIVVVISNFASFLLVALTPKHMKLLIFTGVGFASFASSFGEITFLSMTTLYSRSLSITGWASGTGAAGLIGSFGYAGLTSIGLTPRDTMLIMLVIPVLMTFSYIMLPSVEFARSRQYVDPNEETTNSHQSNKDSDTASIDSTEHLISHSERQSAPPPNRGFIRTKLANAARIMRPLVKFMIPLFLVYYAEYFINQGLFELLYFKGSFVGEHKLQYRWYNVVYQAAVFVSRSSIRWIKITFLPIFPILQILNIFIVLSQIYFEYFPSIWVAFAVIFWEGLLGGGCYVNAFNMVSAEVPVDVREFSIAVTSIADSFGIALAGFTAIPVHNAICDYGSK